jgi:hypothetical protein
VGIHWNRQKLYATVAVLTLGIPASAAAQPDTAAIIKGIDSAVKARVDCISSYTDTEHYKVFRGSDETHAAAEMVVKTTYRPETGKNYEILSENGSGIILKFGLRPLIANEKAINEPGKVSASWFVSANYEMTLKSDIPVEKDGRRCWMLAIHPRRKAPNLIEGTLWVDATDFAIVHLEGLSSKAPSLWSGPAHVMRQYVKANGFAEATHARAESDSMLFGRTVVTIDYEGYKIQIRPGK